MDGARLRQHNLAAVLNRLHRDRGMTRADLTRELGLNRSTIGDLVNALVEAGWVTEIDDAPRRGAGRPSPRVVATDEHLVIAVNPELDAVEVGLVGLGGRVLARRRVPVTDPTVEQAVDIAAAAARTLVSEHPGSRVVAAAAAVPGLVRSADGLVRVAPHLGWREQPVGALLGEALGVPATAVNDAQSGCQAELAFGAGVGARSMVYLNGGASGIGGGIVMEGRLLHGRDGHAGELGHLGIDREGPACVCGARGCLEAVVDRSAVVRALGLEHPDDGELAAAITAARDPRLTALLAAQFAGLRAGLRSIATALNPELIVLGGYLATLWTAADHHARTDALADALPAIATDLRIVPAALGANRLLIGAAERAWEPLLDDPLGAA
jgi:predicted NBD/HSP70 family sugar kinase